jgi:hypothetical protein
MWRLTTRLVRPFRRATRRTTRKAAAVAAAAVVVAALTTAVVNVRVALADLIRSAELYGVVGQFLGAGGCAAPTPTLSYARAVPPGSFTGGLGRGNTHERAVNRPLVPAPDATASHPGTVPESRS